METDWGTNVGTLLGGVLAASLLASATLEAAAFVGLPSIVATPLALAGGAIGFFAVMYLFYRVYLADETPESA